MPEPSIPLMCTCGLIKGDDEFCYFHGGEKCRVVQCRNRTLQGKFVGDLCGPCWEFIVKRKCGGNSQAEYECAKLIEGDVVSDQRSWKTPPVGLKGDGVQ